MMSEELEDEFYQSDDAEECRAQSRNQDSLDNQHRNGEIEEDFNMNLAIDDSMNKNNEGEEENLNIPAPNQEQIRNWRRAYMQQTLNGSFRKPGQNSSLIGGLRLCTTSQLLTLQGTMELNKARRIITREDLELWQSDTEGGLLFYPEFAECWKDPRRTFNQVK